ncbi:GNAT family N-acetyltransferase [Actinoplanes sp. TRM 88003]|uniref:GNAT family N-acetyltransferase n=1 Tax=Paractinoplanes aksuensis TaxID=2939490 RepID=A0ABT1DFG3_9ACTN|nr:GNAT family N-acetyltransferase [Actinoplanes aksuensis]MCO8269562.1 GNAT family N-acetyltransferase [Actinoplanes aksuensis]
MELLTERLRLVPGGPDLVRDLWSVLSDDAVWPWYHREKPTYDQVEGSARAIGEGWRRDGVHKWIAYDRGSGELVGRGGLSRPPLDDDWGQLRAFLPDESWARDHSGWYELGWALRGNCRGRGYATEIGRAGLAYAFGELDAQAVASCTRRDNASSRAVMARLGMRPAGEIVSDGDPYAVSVLLRAEAAAGPSPGRSRG